MLSENFIPRQASSLQSTTTEPALSLTQIEAVEESQHAPMPWFGQGQSATQLAFSFA